MSEHIKVELDFIPIEERLPVEGVDCYGLYAVIRRWGGIDILWFHNAGDDGNTWEEQITGSVVCNVTHWAEIPKVSDASAT